MERDRVFLVESTNPRILNIGCGHNKFVGGVNVDAYDTCNPDITWDLNKTPWPWAKDNEYDIIYALHVFEHLDDWWAVFKECARVLRVGGKLEVRVPDESSGTALSYRDHNHVFTAHSFHGIQDGNNIVTWRSGTNAWALTQEGTVPFRAVLAGYVPFPKYEWMRHFHWLLQFCARHMRNFIWEQVFIFEKI